MFKMASIQGKSLESFYNVQAVQTSYKASHIYRAMAVKYGCALLFG